MHSTNIHREAVLKRQIVQFSHLLHRAGLLVGLDGNLSARLADGAILCTRAGCHKGMLTEDDLVVVDAEGRWLRGLGHPTSELELHRVCYDERPDVTAIIHCHPPLAIAASVAGLDLDRPLLPEVVLGLGTVPTIPYQPTGTRELAESVRRACRVRNALVLERHGVVAMGRTLLESFCHTETVEQVARVTMAAAQLGPVTPLPWAEAVALRRRGLERYGGPPRSIAALDQPGVDLRWTALDAD